LLLTIRVVAKFTRRTVRALLLSDAMINAEELGVNAANASDMAASDNPGIKRLLGTEGNFGAELGLPADWGMQIISQVGNYGESYEAHVGADTPLKLNRAGSVNALWTNGGLLYAPPIR